MPSNYDEISRKHREQYGTDVGRYGGPLLVERYDDRTHFIYELLQNAEDALKRRGDGWQGDRSVHFALTKGQLVVSHAGHPFTRADVESVCSIALSTKGDEAIGKFGIGFKSVYTFTTRPQIHSGDEDFAIRDYVHPEALSRLEREDDQTKIVLPLNVKEASATSEILRGLRALGPSALLFLRHITELSWDISGSASGLYLRSSPIVLSDGVGQITLIGRSTDDQEVDQDWLVFSRKVAKGSLEIAFSLGKDKEGKELVQPLAASPLVVFFPTAIETNLGFLVQGPFLTTPSRDNITRASDWNHHLIEETSALVVNALTWLRDQGRLDIATIRCLPIQKAKFPDNGLFAPLYRATKNAFETLPLLPTAAGTYVMASEAKLARSSELRQLITSEQLSGLYGVESLQWLSGEITVNRTQEVHDYLTDELEIEDVTPDKLALRLTKDFLERQSDEWITQLYEFLNDQPAAVRKTIGVTPFVRLADGTHVLASGDVFLPTASQTGFLTVRSSVCQSDAALKFLKDSLRLAYPDPVDDVIRNILPRYNDDQEIDEDEYAVDVERMLAAYGRTNLISKRDQLIAALKNTHFVWCVDAGNGEQYRVKPSDCYTASDRLSGLLSGIEGLYLVDNSQECLRGEAVRTLLVACGVSRHLRPQAEVNKLGFPRRELLRKGSLQPRTSNFNDRDQDWSIPDLQKVLDLLPTLARNEQVERAKLIWESICDVEILGQRRYFDGEYTWSLHGKFSAQFPASFVTLLNETAWVPDPHGDLSPPKLVVFEDLGWNGNPFVQSKISFKPRIIDQLAQEVGIDPAALDFIRKHGISLADLKEKLGIGDASEPQGTNGDTQSGPSTTTTPDGPTDAYADARDLYDDDMPDPGVGSPDPDADEGTARRPSTSSPQRERAASAPHREGGSGQGAQGRAPSQDPPPRKGLHTGVNKPARTFVSYIGVHDEDEQDPDGLSHADRMKIEETAIDHILASEPNLRRTEVGNPGFDLFEVDINGRVVRWVEVKSMTGTLRERAATMSSCQFRFATEKADAYWLYVVESTHDERQRTIRRIQNPAGLATYFTFDVGWLSVAT